eukprot:2227042-Lingulodinium_polyedra.AAC.1
MTTTRAPATSKNDDDDDAVGEGGRDGDMAAENNGNANGDDMAPDVALSRRQPRDTTPTNARLARVAYGSQ